MGKASFQTTFTFHAHRLRGSRMDDPRKGRAPSTAGRKVTRISEENGREGETQTPRNQGIELTCIPVTSWPTPPGSGQ